MIIINIARTLNKAPSDVENWCLDDIVKIYSSIYFEQEEHRLLEKKMQRDMGN